MGRHLRPLLRQRAGLTLGDQVAYQAEPPGAEDHDDSHDHEGGAADGPQSSGGRLVVHDDQGQPAQTDQHPGGHPQHGDAPAAAVGVLGHERDDVVVQEGALRLAGVAPDEHSETQGEDGGPPDETQIAEVERADRDLRHDHQRHQRDEHPDAGAVVDGAGEDARALAFHRDQQPRHGVGEDRHAGEDAEDDDADADPGDVDPERVRQRAAHASEHPVVRAAAQAPQPPHDLMPRPAVMAMRPAPPAVVGRPVTLVVCRPAPVAVRVGPAAGRDGRPRRFGRGRVRVRAAAVLERPRSWIGRVGHAPMVALSSRGIHQGHP